MRKKEIFCKECLEDTNQVPGPIENGEPQYWVCSVCGTPSEILDPEKNDEETMYSRAEIERILDDLDQFRKTEYVGKKQEVLDQSYNRGINFAQTRIRVLLDSRTFKNNE